MPSAQAGGTGTLDGPQADLAQASLRRENGPYQLLLVDTDAQGPAVHVCSGSSSAEVPHHAPSIRLGVQPGHLPAIGEQIGDADAKGDIACREGERQQNRLNCLDEMSPDVVCPPPHPP